MAFFQYLVFDGENLPLPDSYEVELEDVEADYVVNNDNQLYGVVAAIHLSELYKVLNCRNAFL